MLPPTPAQPPRAATPVKEVAGTSKRPTLPFRGQAPAPLTLRDMAAARATPSPTPTPTAPTQPKAMSAAPKPPTAAPPVPSARPVAAPSAPTPATGPMADDRLQAMQNMRKQASSTPAPSATTAAAAPNLSPMRATSGRLDPNYNRLSEGSLGAMQAGGAVGAGSALAAAVADRQAQAATNTMLNEQGGAGMDMSQVFESLKDPSREPPPGWEWDAGEGHWVPQTGDSALPPGKKAGDPGTYFEDGQWKYGQKEALGEYNLPYTANDLLMGDETQFLMTPEEKAAAQAELDKAAASGQMSQAWNMAAHGLGGTGVAATGLGDIAAKRMSAQNELETSDRAAAMAAYMDKLGLVLPASQNAINEADKMKLAEEANKTDAERWQYQKDQEALANKWAALANVMGLTGADQLEAATLAEALKLDPNKPESWGPVLDAWKKKTTESGNVEAYNSDITPSNAPSGWEDSWNSLNSDQQKAVEEAISVGYNPLTSPLPGNQIQAISGSTWETMTPADKAHAWGLYLKNALTASAW